MTADPSIIEQAMANQEVRIGVISRKGMEASSVSAKEIARAEFVRRRRRLGELTLEQEIAIENLLVSTVIRISRLVGRASETWSTPL